MTPDEHAARAEELLAQWEQDSVKRPSRETKFEFILAAAQVHATLSLRPAPAGINMSVTPPSSLFEKWAQDEIRMSRNHHLPQHEAYGETGLGHV